MNPLEIFRAKYQSIQSRVKRIYKDNEIYLQFTQSFELIFNMRDAFSLKQETKKYSIDQLFGMARSEFGYFKTCPIASTSNIIFEIPQWVYNISKWENVLKFDPNTNSFATFHYENPSQHTDDDNESETAVAETKTKTTTEKNVKNVQNGKKQHYSPIRPKPTKVIETDMNSILWIYDLINYENNRKKLSKIDFDWFDEYFSYERGIKNVQDISQFEFLKCQRNLLGSGIKSGAYKVEIQNIYDKPIRFSYFDALPYVEIFRFVFVFCFVFLLSSIWPNMMFRV